MAASVITYTIEADTDGDGVFETDLTPYVNSRTPGFALSRGLNAQGVYQSGQLTLSLDNLTGLFTPENSGSALYGRFESGVAIRIKATHAATPYTLGIVYMQDASLEWQEPVGGIANYTCEDLAAYLGRYGAIDVVSSTARDSDGAITAILDAMGIAAGLRSLDAGVQAFPFHFVASADAMGAIMDCVASEMGGRAWINKSGQIRFESRAARLGLTVDHTWGDGTNIVPESIRYESNESRIVGKVEVQATIFQQDQLQQEILRFQRGSHNSPADSLFLANGTIYEADFFYDSAVLALAAPVAAQDYLANSNQDGSGADRTSNLSVTVTDKGGRGTVKLVAAADLYVTAFRLQATVMTFLNDRPSFIAAKSTLLGPTDGVVTVSVPWADDTGLVARDYSMHLLRINRYPTPRVQLVFALDRHNDAAASLLAVEIGDLVRYKDTGLGTIGGAMVDDWYYLEELQYAAAAGQISTATVSLIPSYAYRNLDKIVYDLFTRADAASLGTSLSGDVWAGGGEFGVAANKAYATAATERISTLALASADCVVEATIIDATTDADCRAGVVYRYSDDNNHWRAYVKNDGDLVVLEKVVAGVPTVVASAAVTIAGSHELQVLCQGTRHRVRLDRKWILDSTDSALSANTQVGLYANQASTTVYWEDFYSEGL